MILGINQTSSSGSNYFRIMKGEEVLYQAQTPWFPVMQIDKMSKLKLMNANGEVIYRTEYSVMENLSEELLPYKYLFTGSQKFSRFVVVDNVGSRLGAFYLEAKGIADWKMCLEYCGKLLVGYKRSAGYMEYVSFYDGETLVGQMTKSNKIVANNMDNYMVHFVDGYEGLEPSLAFFVIYYDFLYHNHSGQAQKGYKVSYKVSYNKNMDKYNPGFIRTHFGEEEILRMNEFFKVSVESSSTLNMKLFWTIFGVGWGVGLLIVAIVLMIIFL